MTNAMFQLSTYNRLDLKLSFRQGDLREPLEKALQEMSPFIDEKRLSVAVDMDSTDRMSFDGGRIEELLGNLLENACKFTPRSGAIEIKGYPFFWDRRTNQSVRHREAERRTAPVGAPNSYRVDIRDSGPEIPVTHLRRIFEEFTPYSGGHDRSGGGIGLALCRMIVRQHQGRIWAENNPAGAVFSFVLPYERSALECSVEGRV